MEHTPIANHRKSIRIKEYDYSQAGMYFITICTQDKKHILSKIETVNNALPNTNKPLNINDMFNMNKMNVGVGVPDDPNLQLTDVGKIVQKYINNMNKIYSNIKISEYIIMPNHVHMIIEIIEKENISKTGSSRTPTPTVQNSTIPFIISTLKRFTNKQIGYSIWQRNYYEHIIRNEKELYKIIEYIQYNPLNWQLDEYNQSK